MSCGGASQAPVPSASASRVLWSPQISCLGCLGVLRAEASVGLAGSGNYDKLRNEHV